MVREWSMQRAPATARVSVSSCHNRKLNLRRALLIVMQTAACSTGGDIASTPLPPATGSLDEGFTYITSVRELEDGRIILTDPRDQRMLVADLATDSIAPVARRGAGPGEWINAVALHPLGGDSSLQMDPISRRWLYLDGTKIVGMVPTDADVLDLTDGVARGADQFGYIYTARGSVPESGGDNRRRDSLAFVRIHLSSASMDTVAMLRDAPGRVVTAAAADGTMKPVGLSRPAMAVGEEALVFPDGWLAVLRLEPYRVDWYDRNGLVVHGRPLPHRRRPFDAAAREAYLERNRSAIDALSAAPQPMRGVLMTRFTEFPEYFPPIRPRESVAGADGRAYIRRADLKEPEGTYYDIVDRTGALVARLVLGTRERIVAVSDRFVYVIWKDDDDLEHLRRHAMPAQNEASLATH